MTPTRPADAALERAPLEPPVAVLVELDVEEVPVVLLIFQTA